MFKDQNLDFSVLDDLRNDSLSPKDWGLASLMIVILLFLSFNYEVFILLLFVGLFGAIVYVLAALQNLRVHNQSVLEAFAIKNSFTYLPTMGHDFNTDPGTLFTHGDAKKAGNIISGEFAGFPFTLFRYDYATGSGKSRRAYDAEVMEITLPRVLPHMVIDSLVEDGNGSMSTLPIEFDKSQKIELEGDFHNYFSLYAPDKYGISALTVIAPDAMETLLRHAALCDIEIIDNKLYFYWPKVANKKQDYEQIFQTVDQVLSEIGKKLSKGDIFAQVSQAMIHAGSNDQGVRLKKRGVKFITIAGVIFYFCAESLRYLDGTTAIFFAVAYVVVACTVLIKVAQALHKRRELLRNLQTRYQAYDAKH
jgi:hypothetical protein